jgi:uncharacterized membrane protein YcaP (DUF421 family)
MPSTPSRFEHPRCFRPSWGGISIAARETQGVDRLEEIERGVLERNGGISIVPRCGPES